MYHVHYERIKCKIDNTEKWCSVCQSYLTNEADKSINLFNILNYCNSFVVTNNTPAAIYFEETCKAISRFIGLNYNYIKERLLQMLTFDLLIVNDDRHLSNIEVIMYANGRFDIAPIFDNGHSFFRKDSMLTYRELEVLSQKFKSKPFSTNQWKNLIDLDYAKNIAKTWVSRVNELYGGVDYIPGVLDAHKRILKYRVMLLLNK